MRTSGRRKRGFSIIELLLSMGIMSVVLVAVTALFAAQARGYQRQRDYRTLLQNLALVRDQLRDFTSRGGVVQGGTGQAAITLMTATEIRIQGDFNSDGDLTDDGDLKAFNLNGNVLERALEAPGGVPTYAPFLPPSIAVTTLRFECFNSMNVRQLACTGTNAARIEINIRGEIRSPTGDPCTAAANATFQCVNFALRESVVPLAPRSVDMFGSAMRPF